MTTTTDFKTGETIETIDLVHHPVTMFVANHFGWDPGPTFGLLFFVFLIFTFWACWQILIGEIILRQRIFRNKEYWLILIWLPVLATKIILIPIILILMLVGAHQIANTTRNWWHNETAAQARARRRGF